MDYEKIEQLVKRYRDELEEELNVKLLLAEHETEANRMKAGILGNAFAEGLINGKNAETRKLQQAAELAINEKYQEKLQLIEIGTIRVTNAEIDRKHAEALIGLTKAWLYSQSGVK